MSSAEQDRARRALVVEDDPDIVELVSHYLTLDGWAVDALSDGRRALERLKQNAYQLLVLDLQLPGLDGLSICTELRREPRTRQLPVIMLTARADEADRIVGLEVGADDYVVKPFSPKELMARVRALRRRLDRKDEQERLSFERLEVDLARHTVRMGERPVQLTAKEFALLVALLEARGRVLTRERLLEDVWGYGDAFGARTRTVDVHVRRLREKLPELAPAIRTVKSAGYRISNADEE